MTTSSGDRPPSDARTRGTACAGGNTFAVGCGSGGAACSPLRTGTTGDSIYSSPAVADGVVYVTSSDGKLYAFAL